MKGRRDRHDGLIGLLDLVLWWALLLVLALAMAAWLLTVPWPAAAHDPYMDWRQPDNPGASCCHGEDCRPTRAYIGEDGRWRAWDGLGWIIVPASKLLPTDLARDGRSHLCERAGRVLCFSPTGPKG